MGRQIVNDKLEKFNKEVTKLRKAGIGAAYDEFYEVGYHKGVPIALLHIRLASSVIVDLEEDNANVVEPRVIDGLLQLRNLIDNDLEILQGTHFNKDVKINGI